MRERTATSKETKRPSDEARGTISQRVRADAPTEHNPTAGKSLDVRYEAYMSLVNYRIRNAYVGLTSVSHLAVKVTSMRFSFIRSTSLLQTSPPLCFPSTSGLTRRIFLHDSLFLINYGPPLRLSFSSSHQ